MLEGHGHRDGGSRLDPDAFPALGFEGEPVQSCSFNLWPSREQEQKTTTLNLIPAGESFYEWPLVRAALPRPTKYTTARTRLVLQLSYPSSQFLEIRRLTPATLLFSHLVRARCRQQFPCTAQHRRDSVARWSLP